MSCASPYLLQDRTLQANRRDKAADLIYKLLCESKGMRPFADVSRKTNNYNGSCIVLAFASSVRVLYRLQDVQDWAEISCSLSAAGA